MSLRYRRLTIEELEGVRPEFVKYLASEGIAADDWERKLREQSPDVLGCIDAFSQTFWDAATGAIDCLEHRPGDDSVWVFHFAETGAHVIQCQKEGEALTWSQGGKAFEPEARGQEIFLLLEQGATPCSKERFHEVLGQMIAATSAGPSA